MPGAYFIVVLAPVFSWPRPRLSRRSIKPGMPARMGIGLVLTRLAFNPLVLAAQQAGATGMMVSVWWLVPACCVPGIGEMRLSPIGLSAATQRPVPRVAGLMMGAFRRGGTYSEVLAAQFGE